uniref:MlpC n=1 Tax=Metamycoplasma arthritidis TaxID=2111 RepID=Q6E6P1_METAT|nr:MlpC precursor [Mycoplasma arthritidis] [Metamycoplasma arthritidis]
MKKSKKALSLLLAGVGSISLFATSIVAAACDNTDKKLEEPKKDGQKKEDSKKPNTKDSNKPDEGTTPKEEKQNPHVPKGQPEWEDELHKFGQPDENATPKEEKQNPHVPKGQPEWEDELHSSGETSKNSN